MGGFITSFLPIPFLRRLFHHVVDNDRTATLILSHVNRQKKKGDYNFFPLDKLRTSEPRYPQSQVCVDCIHTLCVLLETIIIIPPTLPQEALPMISKLTFDPKFRPAMMTLFGHTLVCRDFEKASEFAQSARMDCITMEGGRGLGGTMCALEVHSVYYYIVCNPHSL